ncbi:MAG: hypothetical protein KIT58_10475, partial [Planctomycetota bacterium]|nr:hypothetical protein [Planctomycetota bacterium]
RAALEETDRRLQEIGPAPTPDDVRAQTEPVVQLPDPVEEQVERLIGFLLQRVYRHPMVEIMCDKGRRLLRHLFEHYMEHPTHLPRQVQLRLRAEGDPDDRLHLARGLVDFVAGITDRHVVLLHEQLFSPSARLLPHID